MSQTASPLERIRQASELVNVAEFAREAEVPYTTVHAFKERDWTHKNLEIIDKLAAAADRIIARKSAA